MNESLKDKISSEKTDARDVWRRIKQRDFSGNTGLALKNSLYQFLYQVVSGIGSLIFTIILARILMPELFGLYNLALSTILIFTSFSELGIMSTIIRFVSRELGKGKKKRAKNYLIYLGKINSLLIIIFSAALLLTAKFISNTYYQKPLFLALVAGCLYILFFGIVSFFQSVLQSFNYFKGLFTNEIVSQVSRIILVPIAALLALKYSLSNESVLFYVILALSLSYLLSSIFIVIFPYRRSNQFKNKKISKLNKQNKKEINKFFLASSILTLSGTFFIYIDRAILGHFVAGEFIGYYSIAFSIIGALLPLLGFGAAALLPIFSRIENEKQLERGMGKSLKVTIIMSVLAFLVTLFLASPLILIIYGNAYNPAINMLRVMSVLILILPLISLYTTYFMSKGKPNILVGTLLASTIINIGLNFLLVVLLIKISETAATYGTIIATIASNLIYLGLVVFFKKRKNL